VKLASLTDVGLKRSHNEDNLLASSLVLVEDGFSQPFHLCMVSDGMGGAAAGEVASQMTIEMVSRRVQSAIVEAHVDRDRGFLNADRLIKDAIETANKKVYYTARSSHLYAGMGATCCLGLFGGGFVTIGHVGDSRCYLFRQGHLHLLTEDHSFVNELVREGRITAEQAAKHPRRNVITRAIGSREDVRVDVLVHPVEAGDLFLFCSDGLSGMLSDGELGSVLRRLCGKPMTGPALNDTCATLVAKANESGGKDNISVVLAGVEHVDVPRRRMRPLPIRPDQTLSWDRALEEGFVDDSFVPVEEPPPV